MSRYSYLCTRLVSLTSLCNLIAYFRAVVDEAGKVLRNAAGNYYINDKSTGSIVAQQPFGGARASGKTKYH